MQCAKYNIILFLNCGPCVCRWKVQVMMELRIQKQDLAACLKRRTSVLG